MKNARDLLFRLTKSTPATEAEVKAAEGDAGFEFPPDYRWFLLEMNGGMGMVGPSYVDLWKVSELVRSNGDYQVNRYLPEIFMFGSDGGGEGYGFDKAKAKVIVRVPFVDLTRCSVVEVAPDFRRFVETLERGEA